LAKLKTNPGAKYKLYWVFFLKLYFTENSIFILVKKYLFQLYNPPKVSFLYLL
jgi:hypothetical protein